MKSTAIFVANSEEREKAESMGVELPEPIYEEDDFYFRMSEVIYCYKNSSGNINVKINDEVWALKWNDELFNAIINYLGLY